MARKKWAVYQVGLMAWVVSLGLYGAGVMGVAYGLVAGWMPLQMTQTALCVSGFFSVLVPCLLWGNRLGLGAMGGCLALWLGFWLALLLVGAVCYGGLCIPDGGGFLVGCTLVGAVLAGCQARRKKAKRLAKRLR